MSERRTSRPAVALLGRVGRYYAVATLVAAGYLGVYALILATGLHYYLAILIAQILTIAWAFPVYRRFVFRSAPGSGDLVRFLGVWAGGAIAGFVLTPALVELFAVPPFWAQLATMLVVSLASFLAHALFTFRTRR